MPPNHWVTERHNRMPRGQTSISVITEDPVVVKPDADSKNAPAKSIPGGHRMYGSPPNALLNNQPRPTIITASRRNSLLNFHRKPPTSIIKPPATPVIAADRNNATIAISSPATTSNLANNPQATIAAATSSSTIPVMRETINGFIGSVGPWFR
jgi:hypothetical protein